MRWLNAKNESKTKNGARLSGINTLAKNKNLPEAPKEQSFSRNCIYTSSKFINKLQLGLIL